MFAGIVMLIPEPKLGPSPDQTQRDLLPPPSSSRSSSSQRTGSGGGGAGAVSSAMRKQREQVLFSGIVTAVGISIHNFPEGVAVFLGSLKVGKGTGGNTGVARGKGDGR